jgi:hypothetical protein
VAYGALVLSFKDSYFSEWMGGAPGLRLIFRSGAVGVEEEMTFAVGRVWENGRKIKNRSAGIFVRKMAIFIGGIRLRIF